MKKKALALMLAASMFVSVSPAALALNERNDRWEQNNYHDNGNHGGKDEQDDKFDLDGDENKVKGKDKDKGQDQNQDNNKNDQDGDGVNDKNDRWDDNDGHDNGDSGGNGGENGNGGIEIGDPAVPNGNRPAGGRDDGGVISIDDVLVPLAGELITRGEVAMLVYDLLGQPQDWEKESLYPDLTEEDAYYVAANVVSELGIFTGRGDGSFHGDDQITRAEMAVVLTRLEQLTWTGADRYTDVSAHWGRGYANAAGDRDWYVELNGAFLPDEELTRGEVYQVLGIA